MKTVYKRFEGGVLHTNGKGFWSHEAREVHVTEIIVEEVELKNPVFLNGPIPIYNIRVYFTPESWNVDEHGLIYTDPLFQKELRMFLKEQGFEYCERVCYTEQGMQGRNFVSLET
jgi:hypothetical protein